MHAAGAHVARAATSVDRLPRRRGLARAGLWVGWMVVGPALVELVDPVLVVSDPTLTDGLPADRNVELVVSAPFPLG